jgi:AcrR family transcriptional regulator
MPRPRSEQAHESVLSAAQKLFADQGIDATSMDAIADASGVSKATIYKHWPNKNALCLEVLGRLHGDPPAFDTGDVRADITALLAHKPPGRTAKVRERIVPHFQSYAARHPEVLTAWKARVLEPPYAQLKRLIERGIAQGILDPDLHVDLGVAMLLGPMIFRYAAGFMKPQLPPDMAERIVEAFWRAHGKKSTNSHQFTRISKKR